MKVLHVIASLDPRFGGPAVALSGLANAQVAAGIEVAIVHTVQLGETGEAAEELRRGGVIVEPIQGRYDAGSSLPRLLPLGWGFALSVDLTQQVRRLAARCDILHLHGVWDPIIHAGARAARQLGLPYLVRPCGMLDPWSLEQGRFKKQVYMAWRLRRDLDGASNIHYTSELERDLARPLRLKPPALVVPNGVDLREFESLPPPGFLRGRFPTIGARRIVLFLSRLHYKKGLDLLVEAFARVASADRVLVITGPDDGLEAELRRRVRSLGLDGSVLFTGPLYGSQRVAALRDADLFVLPSRQENFGIVVIEALAAGVPVLISDQVNIHREIADAGVGGVVPLDVDRLASGLNHWLEDSAARRRATSLARGFVQENYDWLRIARRWHDEYGRLLRESSRRGKLLPTRTSSVG